ncbi:MAG: MFS transporter [Acidobacteriaceae bacterium]
MPEAPALQTTSPPSAHSSRASLIFTIYSCMFIFGLVLFLAGTLLPTLHIGYEHAGRLGSLPLVGILAASVVIGPILDIHGAKEMLILALILIAASLALIPAFHLYWQLEICCLTYGFGGGVLNTATNVLIADLHAESRTRALNLLGFFFSAGAVLAPLLMSSVGGLSSSVVLRLLAALTALLLVPVLFFHFPPPLRAGLRVRNLLTVLHQPLVWLFGIILIFESGNENCMFVWTAKFVTDALHAPAAQGSLALACLGAALGLGRLGTVLWLHRLGNRGVIASSVTLVLAGVLIAANAHSAPTMILAVTVIGLGISAIYPTVLGLAGERFPGETGTAFGAIIALSLVGGTAGPLLGGYAISHSGLSLLWIPAISAVVIGLLITMTAIWRSAQSVAAEGHDRHR